jgi:hypothetical protein
VRSRSLAPHDHPRSPRRQPGGAAIHSHTVRWAAPLARCTAAKAGARCEDLERACAEKASLDGSPAVEGTLARSLRPRQPPRARRASPARYTAWMARPRSREPLRVPSDRVSRRGPGGPRRRDTRRENSCRPPPSGLGARSPLSRGPHRTLGSGSRDLPPAPKKQGVDTPPRRFYSSGLDTAATPAAHRPQAERSRKKPGRWAFLPGREARPPPRPCDRCDREVARLFGFE